MFEQLLLYGLFQHWLFLYGDLIDIRQVAANGQDVYIRMPASKKSIGLLSWLLFNSYFEMPFFFLLLLLLLDTIEFRQ